MTRSLSRIHLVIGKACQAYKRPCIASSLWTPRRRTMTPLQKHVPPTFGTTEFTGFIHQYHSHSHHHGSGHQHDSGHQHTDLATTLKATGKKGVQITILGLAANVGLTASKGVAGWYMNSASLLADAAHSLSDLLSDFVTLYTFKMSRKPPDDIYPYGYGKYETVGSFVVSTLLITGGAAIGLHSFDLLLAALEALSSSASSTSSSSPEVAHSVVNAISSITTSTIDATAISPSSSTETLAHHHASPSSPSSDSSLSTVMSTVFHLDHHHDSTTLDPNAAWFALVSVAVKEWLYRITLKVGKSEHSDVLIANAWHHRSDAFSSLIALVAIGGSYAGLPVLDPLGGLLVSGFIVRSGASIMSESLKELIDKGIPPNEIDNIKKVIAKVKDEEPQLVDYYSIRGRKLGPFKHLDMILQLDPKLPVEQAHRIEQRVRSTVKKEIPMVQEILIHVDAEKQPPHH